MCVTEEGGVTKGVTDEDGWIILRTSGQRTLRLLNSLREDGYEVWTPQRRRRVRVPRHNVRREVDFALLPSFVFARAHHLIDLLELAAMPVKPRRGAGGRKPTHDVFSVFHHLDGIPVIADRDLDPLREEETRIARRPHFFHRGEKVRVTHGAGTGLTGTVLCGDDRFTLVCLGGNMRVKIPTSILRPDEACAPTALRGTAARAA